MRYFLHSQHKKSLPPKPNGRISKSKDSCEILHSRNFSEHNIHNLTPNEYIHIEIKKFMYGLKEVGILALNSIVKNLTPFVYHMVKHTPGLWKYETRPTIFTLCVDDL